jgi:hypothetical protein
VPRVRVRLDLGAGVTLGGLAEVMGDMSTTMDLGLKVDRQIAEFEAGREVERLWRERPRVLVERFERDEWAAGELRILQEMREFVEGFREHPVPPDLWYGEWVRFQRRVGGKRARRVAPPWPWFTADVWSLREANADLYSRLVASEAGRHLAAVPIVESLAYQNPLEVVILFVGGAAAAGCKYGTFVEILKVIRDWSGARGQAHANAEKTKAETREINARASQTELETEIRRKLAVHAVTHPELGKLEFSQDELSALRRLSAAETDVVIEDD